MTATPAQMPQRRPVHPVVRPRPVEPPPPTAVEVAFREAQEAAVVREAERIVRATLGHLR